MLNFFKKKGTGALLDTRQPFEQAKDYRAEELVASFNPVEWKEKTEWRKFPISDQNGSGSCFPGNALILMEDLSEKPISLVRLGDVVVTHKGNKKKVTRLFKRKWQGTMTLLKVRGVAKEIEATNEHPVYGIKRTAEAKPYQENASFYEISELKSLDWVAIPIPREIRDTTLKEFETDPDFLWSLGLYLAEGSIDKYCVTFSLHSKETDYYEKLKRTFEKYGSNVTVSFKKQDKGMCVKLQGKQWTTVFEELGGRISDKKRIASRLMRIEPHLQMKIVEGIFDGDGYYGRERNVLVSTSKELIQQTKNILLRNGIFSFEQKRSKKEGRKQVWTLEYSKTSRYSFLRDEYVFVQIASKRIKKSFQGGHVYNIEVEEDNSYIVNSVAVHNCVAMTGAKLLGISHYLKSGEFVPFSATDIYRRRSNKPSGGMAGTDALDIIKNGVTLEALLPSQKLTDEQMTNITVEKYKEQVGEVFKVSNYIVDPVRDIDAIASIIQTTGKGVMVWYYFANNGEWSEVPTIKGDLDVYGSATARHSVTAVDWTLYQGKKALVIDDSWGNAYGKAGQRIITEDFHKVRNFFSAHIMNFKFEETLKPQFTFTKDLSLGMRDEEVVALQDRLKAEGLFPTNTQSTGYFGSVTKKAVILYQAKNGLPQTGFVGEMTRAKLNMVQ